MQPARNYIPALRYGAKIYPSEMVIAPHTSGKYWFVDGNKSGAGSGTTWEDAFTTIQAAVDVASGNDVILVAPIESDGSYAENVLVGGTSAKEYANMGLRIIGVGNVVKNVRIRASSATTKRPFSNLAGTSVLGSCMSILCAGVEVSGFCFDASGNYNGLYIGDGYRINTGYGYDSMQCRVHDCTFKYGISGITYDGASSDQMCHDNYFYKQSDVGVYIDEGGVQHSQRVHVYNNFFNGPEDYGVVIYNHAQCKDHIIACNVFKDQLTDTTEMTNPVICANATPTNAVVGNWCACDNDCSVGTKSFSSGNYDGYKAGGGTYVSEA